MNRLVPPIRYAGACLGIMIALLTTVSLPISGVWIVWQWAYHDPAFFSILEATNQQLTFVAMQWSLPEIRLFLPRPPSLEWVVSWTSLPMLAMLFCLMLIDSCVPLKCRAQSACRTSIHPVPTAHPLHSYMLSVAHRYRTGPIRLFVAPIPGIQAMVLSSPWRQHAIVISHDLLVNVPLAIGRWVVAHEIAHVHYGDTRSASLMLLSLRGIHTFAWLEHKLGHAILQTLAFLPMLRLIVMPLTWCLRALMLAGRVGRYVGGSVFRLFDRWASRRMELRADAFAALEEGAAPGLALLSAISQGFEPRFGLLATHPSPTQRIDALTGTA